MKRIKILISILFFGWMIVLSPALATKAFAEAKNDLSCACTPNAPEPYENARIYTQGLSQGECIDSCRFRNLVVLKKNSDGRIHLANILHGSTYWSAMINPRDVEGVSLLFENFLPQVSHVALQFRFNKEIEMTSILNKQKKYKMKDLVFSAEAALPYGEKLKLLPSLNGSYVLAYRFLSLDETYTWMILNQKHKVKQFPLDLTPEQGSEALLRAIDLSVREQMTNPYFLLTQNCATSAMKVLGQSLPSFWDQRFQAFPLNMNFGTLRVLRAQRLIHSENNWMKQSF
jgi:hypothetical protein